MSPGAAMSRSKKVFGLIKRDLSGVQLCKDMLVVLPTEHIVRGFLIERTMERDRIYLWRVVTPLHRPMSRVLLDYSRRIPESGEEIYIKRDAYKESADAIRAIICEHVEYLQGVRRPQDFLRHVEGIVDRSSINFRFDLALTCYRVGKMRDCAEILRALDVEVDQLDEGMRLPVDHEIKLAARVMERDPTGLAALLDEWEEGTIEKLGLQPTRLMSRAPALVG